MEEIITNEIETVETVEVESIESIDTVEDTDMIAVEEIPEESTKPINPLVAAGAVVGTAVAGFVACKVVNTVKAKRRIRKEADKANGRITLKDRIYAFKNPGLPCIEDDEELPVIEGFTPCDEEPVIPEEEN